MKGIKNRYLKEKSTNAYYSEKSGTYVLINEYSTVIKKFYYTDLSKISLEPIFEEITKKEFIDVFKKAKKNLTLNLNKL